MEENMAIQVSSLCIPGNDGIGQNPLPCFRDPNPDVNCASNGTLGEADLTDFGRNAARRVLPYLTQDRYSREREPVCLKTVVLENEFLHAEFLADFGGRLRSLRNRETGRELLFANPVLQPGNLGIRNAWFSGGIEWNFGQFGHTCTTCSPLFFARMRGEDSREFLRMYEYERQKGLFWHIDFHLPSKSRCLQAYVRIINDSKTPKPFFWWTNIAVPETPGVRVFSAASEVIFQDMEAVQQWMKDQGKAPGWKTMKNAPAFFGRGRLPYIENERKRHFDFDASFPQNFSRASEYFFQNSQDLESPWEAAAYEDGFVFFERSTQPLRFRKMFCWGTHRGGRLWCDYLSEKGRGDYLEIQAGCTPTQLHGCYIAPESEICFSQMFSCVKKDDPSCFYAPWEEARNYMEKTVEEALPPAELIRIHEINRRNALSSKGEILHSGSGWGALEVRRRVYTGEKTIPPGFSFPESSLTKEHLPWLSLLETGVFPPIPKNTLPLSYMTDSAWASFLEKSIDSPNGAHGAALNCLAVLFCENGEEAKAVKLWERAAETADPLALRNLACIALRKNDLSGALSLMERAFTQERGLIDPAFTEEYLRLLVDNRQFETAWKVFNSLPRDFRENERIAVSAGQAAIETGKYDFVQTLFDKELVFIKEGETTISDLWYRLQAINMAQARGVPYTEGLFNEALETLTPPGKIDFRMYDTAL
jgi:hypothetical protein